MEIKKILKLLLIIIIILIIVDQASKILVDKFLNEDVSIISNILTITKLENEGMAFGLNKQNFSNILLTIIILIIIINYIIKQRAHMNNKTIIFLAVILAGGFSNLIDRIFRGAVFDFIKISYFPIFNLADSFIVIGWVLFVINFILYAIKSNNKGV